MDSLKLKNKVAGWLTFKMGGNLDLSHPSLDRLDGKLKNIIKFKRALYASADSIFTHLEKETNISFVDVDQNNHKRNHHYTFNLESGTSVDIKLINKLAWVYNKPHFNLTYPKVEASAYSLRECIEENAGMYKKSLLDGKITFSKPRIYFDYIDFCFKVDFILISTQSKADIAAEKYRKDNEEWARLAKLQAELQTDNTKQKIDPVPFMPDKEVKEINPLNTITKIPRLEEASEEKLEELNVEIKKKLAEFEPSEADLDHRPPPTFEGFESAEVAK